MARVLAIEDDVPVARNIERLLEVSGHDVHVAGTAESAIVMIQAYCFDVALVDYQLAGIMDGLDVLRCLQEAQPGCARILVTGHLDLPLAVNAVNKGEINRVIRKPFRKQELLSAIEDSVAYFQRRNAWLRRQVDDTSRDERQMLEDGLGPSRFRLALQPIVDSKDGHAVGWEGLARTDHPAFDGPRTLLTVARRHQMVPEVGSVVARRAADWLDRLPAGTGLFINVHPDEFADSGSLVERLAPLRPHQERLVLEVTGECLDHWPNTFQRKVEHLRSEGFAFAIDDLGVAQNSLRLLAETEPAFIKVNTCLIRGIDKSSRKRKLLDMTLKFADATGAGFVAKGVETADEAATLRGCGVVLMQGYLFGRPRFDDGSLQAKPLPRRATDAESH